MEGVWKAHLLPVLIVWKFDIRVQDYQDSDLLNYHETLSAGANALPFMKTSYSITHGTPLLRLPPEMLERVYMYCTMGRLSIEDMRRLYPKGVLLGMRGITDREIVHLAVETNHHSLGAQLLQ